MIMILDQGGNYCSPCNTIWKTVDKLPLLDEASRNHAYVLPDNTVWVLNHDGTEFITSSSGSLTHDALKEQVIELDDNKENRLKSTDETITIAPAETALTSTDKTDINVNADKVALLDNIKAGKNVSVKKNGQELTISADVSAGSYIAGAGIDSIKLEKENTISENIEYFGISGRTTAKYEIGKPLFIISEKFMGTPDDEGNGGNVAGVSPIKYEFILNLTEYTKDNLSIEIGEGIARIFNNLKQFHKKLYVGDIEILYDDKTKKLTLKGLNQSNEWKPYTSTYLLPKVDAVPF